MRKHLATLLAAMASMIFAGAEARAENIYVLTNNVDDLDGTVTDFGRIDSVTGVYSSIASLTGAIGNLTWNPTAGNFFATAANTATLRTLSTTGTLSNSIGNIGHTVYGMAYRTADSTIYAYSYSDQTGTIDSSNGSWTTLNGSPGLSTNRLVGGRYSIMNDAIYMAATGSGVGRFGTMGYTASSTFQEITTNSLYVNMVLANDGTTMYGIYGNPTAGLQQLYTIDVNTGVATAGAFITGTGLGTFFHGAAIVPEAVPEIDPAGMGSVLALVGGALGLLERRRRVVA